MPVSGVARYVQGTSAAPLSGLPGLDQHRQGRSPRGPPARRRHQALVGGVSIGEPASWAADYTPPRPTRVMNRRSSARNASANGVERPVTLNRGRPAAPARASASAAAISAPASRPRPRRAGERRGQRIRVCPRRPAPSSPAIRQRSTRGTRRDDAGSVLVGERGEHRRTRPGRRMRIAITPSSPAACGLWATSTTMSHAVAFERLPSPRNLRFDDAARPGLARNRQVRKRAGRAIAVAALRTAGAASRGIGSSSSNPGSRQRQCRIGIGEQDREMRGSHSRRSRRHWRTLAGGRPRPAPAFSTPARCRPSKPMASRSSPASRRGRCPPW